MKFIPNIAGALIFALAIGAIFQSATSEAGPTQDQVVVPSAVTITQADSVKTMDFNSRELKADYKTSFQIELVENSGTVTTEVKLQGSNFTPSVNLWDDVFTNTFAATGDTTIDFGLSDPTYAYYRLYVAKATSSGDYSVTVNCGAKLNAQSR